MPAVDWHELDRISAPPGSCARDAIDWWVGERFGLGRKWEWIHAATGTFRIDGRDDLYRVLLGGVETDFWVFQRFFTGDSTCVT